LGAEQVSAGAELFTTRVIDVRNPKAWAETDNVIPEAIRVPSDKLEEKLPRIPKARPVVTYCT